MYHFFPATNMIMWTSSPVVSVDVQKSEDQTKGVDSVSNHVAGRVYLMQVSWFD